MEPRTLIHLYLLFIVIPLLYEVYKKTVNPKPTDYLPYGLKWTKEFKDEYNRKQNLKNKKGFNDFNI